MVSIMRRETTLAYEKTMRVTTLTHKRDTSYEYTEKAVNVWP